MTSADYRRKAVLATMESLLLLSAGCAVFGFSFLSGVLETHRALVVFILIALGIPATILSARAWVLASKEKHTPKVGH